MITLSSLFNREKKIRREKNCRYKSRERGIRRRYPNWSDSRQDIVEARHGVWEKSPVHCVVDAGKLRGREQGVSGESSGKFALESVRI